MNNNQTNQKIKDLIIHFNKAEKDPLQSFRNQFSEMGKDEEYSVSVLFWRSNEEMEKTLKEMFELIFSQNLNLMKIYFGSCTLSESFLTLFSEQKWEKLEVLQISMKMIILDSSKIDDKYLSLLSNCFFPSLTKLVLSECEMTKFGISHIFNGNWLNLTELNLCTFYNNLEFCKITSKREEHNENLEKRQKMSELFNLSKLAKVYLWSSKIEERILCELDFQRRPSLEFLNIEDCPISGKELFNLEKNLGWGNLKHLMIGSKKINQEEVCLGVSNICQYHLPNLKQLEISEFNMSKKCIVNFRKSNWNNLEALFLCKYLIKEEGCPLENESMKVFSKCEWKLLKQFKLFNNKIGNSGMDYLGCSDWSELHRMKLSKYYVIAVWTNVTTLGFMNLLKLSVKELELNIYDKNGAIKIIKQVLELPFKH